MFQPDGLFWIYSDSDEQYGGLRLATFFTIDGGVQFMIIHGETSDRIGVREWDRVQENERFFKVARIDMPTREMIDAARSLGSPVDEDAQG